MTPTRFALYVTANPISCQGQLSALRFAEAVVASGHKVARVFFAGDAVLIGNAHLDIPGDEPQLQQRWQALVESGETELLLCSAAAQRSGLRSDSDGIHNLAQHFSISGLGSLVECTLDCDRVIHFPG